MEDQTVLQGNNEGERLVIQPLETPIIPADGKLQEAPALTTVNLTGEPTVVPAGQPAPIINQSALTRDEIKVQGFINLIFAKFREYSETAGKDLKTAIKQTDKYYRTLLSKFEADADHIKRAGYAVEKYIEYGIHKAVADIKDAEAKALADLKEAEVKAGEFVKEVEEKIAGVIRHKAVDTGEPIRSGYIATEGAPSIPAIVTTTTGAPPEPAQ